MRTNRSEYFWMALGAMILLLAVFYQYSTSSGVFRPDTGGVSTDCHLSAGMSVDCD